MSYDAYLRRMPGELRARLERQDIYAPWLGRGETMASILTSVSIMETVFNRMSSAERRALGVIVRSVGCEPFDERRLEKAADGLMTGAEARAGLIGLLHKLIVFAFRKSWGEHVYVLPQEGLKVWQAILVPEPLTDGEEEPSSQSGLTVLASAETELSRELVQALACCAAGPLKLTKNGTLHKKTMQRLSDSIGLETSLLAGLGLKYAFSDIYPLKLALVADMLLRLGLLKPQPEAWALEPEACAAWLRRCAAEQQAVLYRMWRMAAFPERPWLQHAALALESLPEGMWLAASSLTGWLQASGLLGEAAAEDGELLLASLEQSWINAMIAFGWMEKAADEAGRVHYRWSEKPAQRGADAAAAGGDAGVLIVQPDFDVLVPPQTPPLVRFELESFADRVASGKLSVYRMSKDSVRRGLESDRTAAEMLALLERNAAYGVPGNVRETLAQWARPFGQARFERVILLRCSGPEVADRIERLPGAAEWTQGRIGERDLLVSPQQVRPLKALLEKAGFMPGDVALPEPGDEGLSKPRYPKLPPQPASPAFEPLQLAQALPDGKGLLYVRSPVAYFEMEKRLPEPYDLYPELSHIPAAWLKEYRTYHSSTRKEIVEKAIEWKAVLQLRRGGCDYRIAPRKVTESRGSWCLSGWEPPAPGDAAAGLGSGWPRDAGLAKPAAAEPRQEIRWYAEEWQEMKLILPGINEK